MEPKPLKLLLIEDNTADARLTQTFLNDAYPLRFEIFLATRLSAGLELLNRESVDVVLLDLSLPDSSGLATFTELHVRVPGLPVIVLSGTEDEAIAGKAVEEGAQDYLVKACVDSDLLRRAIHHAIERQRVLTILEQRAEQAQSGETRLKRQLDRLASLRQIDLAISSSMDLRVTLSVILDQVANQLAVDAADILLYNPISHSLEYTAGLGFSSKGNPHTRLRLGEDYAGQAALERRVIHIPDLSEAGPSFNYSIEKANEGFIDYFGLPLIANGHVKGVLEVFNKHAFAPDQEWLDFLDNIARQTAIAIDNMTSNDALQRSNIELTLAYDVTLESWFRALEARQQEPEGSSLRMAEKVTSLARSLGVPDNDLVHLRRGALLHDIGHLSIPESILLKPGPLSPGEWELVRKHPSYSYELLSPITFLRPALDIPYYHHEKWDGSGYPLGLIVEQIPLAARIFAVVDVWEALVSERPYRPAWQKIEALEFIRQQAGMHFDPQVVEAFLEFQKRHEI